MKTKVFLTMLTAVSLYIAAPAPASGDYIAHEWGTFTSVQGADGVQLEWSPLTVPELPNFVHDRPSLASVLGTRFIPPGKDGFHTLQRMETPVIYFYSQQPETVDVTVNFPSGIV